MNSKKENEDDWEESYEKKAEKLGLSDEAKLDEEQKDNIKSLGDNRFLVSTNSVKDEDIPEEMKSPGKKKETSEEKGLKQEMSEQISKERERREGETDSAEKIAEAVLSKLEEKRLTKTSDKKEERSANKPSENRKTVKGEKETPIKEPQNLVKLLSTYRISLDAPIRKLIKSIKKKGKDHLEKELEKFE